MEPTVDNRPWGTFTRYTQNELSTVKVIEILPGKRLSLQSHTQREEWWLALDDGVITEINGVQRQLKRGEMAFVPVGARHRLCADMYPARVLEIAFGNFDESDIIRYEDDFGRA